MSISQRKDGRYVVKYKNKEGHWKQCSFRSLENAEVFDAEQAYDAATNTRLSLEECVIAYLKNRTLSARTVRAYRGIIGGGTERTGEPYEGVAQCIANKYADSLNRLDLETVRENCRRRGVSIGTINEYVGKLNAALNWCVSEDLLNANPWARYRYLPGAKKEHREGTLEDFRTLYPFLPPWLQWASKTALALCLRPGLSELFALTWDAFDWRAKAVRVFMPKVQGTKTVYPPEAYLAEAWERYSADRGTYSIVCRNANNRQIRDSRMYLNHWSRACQRAGVRIVPYALRHIAASEMLAAGADLAAVAAQLGHKNIATTAGFYTHAVANAQRRASELLPFGASLVQPR